MKQVKHHYGFIDYTKYKSFCATLIQIKQKKAQKTY